MKDLSKIALVVVCIVIVTYAGWQIKRYVNYKLSYQSQVQKEIKPYVVRIENLEKRVSELEKKN